MVGLSRVICFAVFVAFFLLLLFLVMDAKIKNKFVSIKLTGDLSLEPRSYYHVIETETTMPLRPTSLIVHLTLKIAKLEAEGVYSKQ